VSLSNDQLMILLLNDLWFGGVDYNVLLNVFFYYCSDLCLLYFYGGCLQ